MELKRVKLTYMLDIDNYGLTKGNNLYSHSSSSGSKGEQYSGRDMVRLGENWKVYIDGRPIYLPKTRFRIDGMQVERGKDILKEKNIEDVLKSKQDKPMTRLNELVKEQMFTEEVKQKFISVAKETTMKIKKLTREITKKEKEKDRACVFLDKLNYAFEEKNEDFLLSLSEDGKE